MLKFSLFSKFFQTSEFYNFRNPFGGHKRVYDREAHVLGGEWGEYYTKHQIRFKKVVHPLKSRFPIKNIKPMNEATFLKYFFTLKHL